MKNHVSSELVRSSSSKNKENAAQTEGEVNPYHLWQGEENNESSNSYIWNWDNVFQNFTCLYSVSSGGFS